MGLSVADIDRWSADAVRSVFHAARLRAGASTDAADGLGKLPAFQTWGGRAAEAARQAVGTTRVDLNAHGEEALAVARAADIAADGIGSVQRQLRELREQAHLAQMDIDPVTDRIVADPGFKGNASQLAANIAELQPELDTIIAEANAVDQELARAVNMADGKEPIPADAGPPVGEAGLTPSQRASDANEERLREARIRTQADVDALQRQLDELRAEGNVDGGVIDAVTERLSEARTRLGELDAVTQAMSNAPETYLAQLDIPAYGNPVHAAVAVGNPDTATNVAVTVPGVGSSVKDTLPGMVTEARNLQRTAQDELIRLGRPGSVATIAWMGYDPPANPLNTTSPRDLWRVMNDQRAQLGAPKLADFLQQIKANNPNAHISLFGHSYGSLTASLALQQLKQEGVHIVDDAVFYGSPGLEITNPDQFGLANGHAYVMRASGDPITGWIAPTAPLHGWGLDPYLAGLPELSSAAGTSPDGVARTGAHGHSEYPHADTGPGGNPVLKMPGYNLAIIAAGIADAPDGSRQLMMAPARDNPRPHPGG